MAKPEKYVYGITPNPGSWHAAAKVLQDNKAAKPKRRKPSMVLDRLDKLEGMLKDKNGS